jgi:hypothetical protein
VYRSQSRLVVFYRGDRGRSLDWDRRPAPERPQSKRQASDPLDELRALRKATKRHIPYKELAPEARFDRLSTQSKHFIDIIKMIAYRAETAMAQILRRKSPPPTPTN